MSELSVELQVAEIEVVLAAKLWHLSVLAGHITVVDQRAKQLARAVDRLLLLEKDDVPF